MNNIINLFKKLFFIDEQSSHIGLSALRTDSKKAENPFAKRKVDKEIKLSDLMRKAG